jgi:hypothetical protein
MYHFVYLSFEEQEPYREYVGVHSTEDINDGYLGSFSDSLFSPTDKIILEFFSTREKSIIGEMRWQRQLKVKEDSKFANKSYQTSDCFDTSGSFWWYNPNNPTERVVSINGPENWVRGQGPLLSEKRKGKQGNMSGKSHSEETKRRMSENRAGDKNGMFGKKHSTNSIQKMIDAKKDIPTNLTWWNDGEKEDLFSEDPKNGWEPGRIKRKWWTNSEKGKTAMSAKCPGEGWVPGRARLGPRE